jgi:transposase
MRELAQEEDRMRFYNRQHRHYCGIDLHVKTMYVCILDTAGQVLVHRNVPSTPEAFLETVAPHRDDLVVAAECMFTWYWLADLCAAEGIAFVLGHALAMKAIHGGKAKNDQIDSHKIAVLLRGGMLPQSYVYPAAMRSTRDLIRRRLHLVRKRGQLLAHIQNTRAQYNLPVFGRKLAYKALTILYEIHDVTRFDRVQEFASYARLVKCGHQSAGKKLGTGGAKMGNVHLKWAFSEAAVLFLRHTKDGKKILARIEKKHGKGKALSILAHKIGRAVFYVLSRGTVFSMDKFLAA